LREVIPPVQSPVHLRPFTSADFLRLIGWITSPEMLIQWAGPTQFTFPLSREQLELYSRGSEGATPIRKVFTARDSSGDVLGHIELGALDFANQSGTLCRVLIAPPLRGRGLSVPMVQEALRIGFDEMGLRRIELRVYSFNAPAIKSYLRTGFVQEGVLRRALKIGTEYWDTVLMAILREEWRPER
jgi:RimJ/RimL family protein N-acetyltransferase